MPELTPAQRVLRSKLAAHTRWANTPDPSTATAPARRAFDDRFMREADPTGELPYEERVRRADHLRKAYFARLALLSSKARAAKKASRSRRR